MKLQPLEDRIVVKPGESEETTASAWSSPRPPRRSPSRARSWRSVPASGPSRPAT